MTDYVFATAGSKLSIAASLPATNTEAAFEAVEYDEIGYIQNMGEIGNAWNFNTFFPVYTKRGIPVPTSNINNPTSIVTSYSGGNDSGQEQLRTAASQSSLAKKAFAIEHPSGKNIYFHAYVGSAPISLGTVEDVTTQTFNLQLSEEDIIIGDAPASL